MKIEAGKTYVNILGEKIGPMISYGHGVDSCFD